MRDSNQVSFVEELQRRNVLRVAIAYLAGSWLLIQIAETLLPIYGFGNAVIRIVVAILLVGFIPTVVFTWVFELTPEGLKRDSEVDRSQSITQTTGKKLDRAIIIVLGLALAYFAFDKLVLSESRIDSAREKGRIEGMVESYGDKSIAVLPFVDMSAAADQEYMSDGIAEELLNLLAKVQGLRVISRTSAFSFKGKDISIPEIAEQLNVAHVLEGSVRKSGNRIRITAQLIEAGSDTHLWSETYDRALDDIFAIQDEVSAQVVNELKIVLFGDAPKSIVTDPEAYELFLQARFLADQVTVDSMQKAIGLYERVLDIDPEYVPAWVGMSEAHRTLAFYDVPNPKTHLRLQAENIERALEIDPDNANALAMASEVSAADGDIERAVSQIRRALEIAPTDLEVIENSLFVFEKLGRYSDYADMMEYVLARDPLNLTVRSKITFAYLMTGDYKRTIELSEQTLTMSPVDFMALLSLPWAEYFAGNPEAALRLSERVPGSWYRTHVATVAHHALGNQEAYASGVQEMLQMLEDGEPLSTHYGLAMLYGYVGDQDAAFSELENSIERGEGLVHFDDLPFTALIGDPRYDDLLERAGMPREIIEAIQLEVKLPPQ
jgi:TolB-like protein